MRKILSPHRHQGRNGPVRLAVIHTSQFGETAMSALDCAMWFRNPQAKVSAHYNVDSDEIIQSVDEGDVAWCAPGANHDGIHIELAGKAEQTADQWADTYSLGVLKMLAPLLADICKRHNIPARWLTDEELAAGAKGIVGHDQVSRVYKKSDHFDPGKAFPRRALILMVNNVLAGKSVDVNPNPWVRRELDVTEAEWLGPDWAQLAMQLLKKTSLQPCSNTSLISAIQTTWKIPVTGEADEHTVKIMQGWFGQLKADGVLGPKTAARGRLILNRLFVEGKKK